MRDDVDAHNSQNYIYIEIRKETIENMTFRDLLYKTRGIPIHHSFPKAIQLIKFQNPT